MPNFESPGSDSPDDSRFTRGGDLPAWMLERHSSEANNYGFPDTAPPAKPASPPKPPKATKKALLAFLRDKLRTNERWAVQGLLRVYANQTSDEQHAHETREHNGIGFTSLDAEYLSACAQSHLDRGQISRGRMVYVLQKMPKYAAQLMATADLVKLENAWRRSLSLPAQTEFTLTS